MQITEMFFSIQGESLDTGLPCVFIRLTGCNLRCTYCDTRYAYEGGTRMTVEAVMEAVRRYPCRRVAVTGGEPLLQAETPDLTRRLLDEGYRVLVETNGSVDIDLVDSGCVRVVDVKCPSSGEHERHLPENFTRLTHRDQLKFVIGDPPDFRYATRIVREALPEGFPDAHLLFSPAFGRMTPERLARLILEEGLNVRLHLQLHKIIWPHKDRGV